MTSRYASSSDNGSMIKVVALRMTPRSRFAILVGTSQPRSAKIMLTERGKLFEEKEPSLYDDEVSAAYETEKLWRVSKGNRSQPHQRT